MSQRPPSAQLEDDLFPHHSLFWIKPRSEEPWSLQMKQTNTRLELFCNIFHTVQAAILFHTSGLSCYKYDLLDESQFTFDGDQRMLSSCRSHWPMWDLLQHNGVLYQSTPAHWASQHDCTCSSCLSGSILSPVGSQDTDPCVQNLAAPDLLTFSIVSIRILLLLFTKSF